jgi:hypothetical protein
VPVRFTMPANTGEARCLRSMPCTAAAGASIPRARLAGLAASFVCSACFGDSNAEPVIHDSGDT